MCFQNGCIAQRKVNGHLVSVKVGVECRTGQRVELDSLPFNKFWLKCLDPQSVEGRGTVEQYGMPFHYVLQNIPYHRVFTVNYLFGRFYSFNNAAFNKFPYNERFVEFGGHVLGKPAFMHLQFGSYHDNGTGGIVNTFTKQVLAETALFPFKAVGQRFKSTISFCLNGIRFAGVIEQGIDGFLEHTFFVAQNDLGSFNLDKAFETVVANDHPAVQVIQVRGGKPSPVEGYQRPQIGRNHRDDLHDHPLGFVDLF